MEGLSREAADACQSGGTGAEHRRLNYSRDSLAGESLKAAETLFVIAYARAFHDVLVEVEDGISPDASSAEKSGRNSASYSPAVCINLDRNDILCKPAANR
jgi:hypothetical protein